MTARNYILSSEDERYLTPNELRKHADYQGDAEPRLALRAMARKLLAADNPLMQPNNVTMFLDSPVIELPLSSRALTAISFAGYRTVREVFEYGWKPLMRQRNFGERTRLELLDLFARYGLVWQEDVSDVPEVVNDERVVACPAPLYADLLRAARSDLANFELKHGRFARRGALLPEYQRLTDVVERAEKLVD